MAPDEGAALKLRAEDTEDLAVISACLQDALVAVRDLAYVPEERSFLFVANRFRWEDGLRPAPGETPYQRVLCGITFSEVAAAAYSGFRRSDNGRILCLLAIRAEDRAIHLEFSEGAAIRLGASRILCHAQDLGDPWPTPWLPRHDVDEVS
ncbi:MAG: DUF2948 family protein [Alphaproteobacteria bacterium]|nr:DUF2948 family protein [Alphaproteobacteria bacterium]